MSDGSTFDGPTPHGPVPPGPVAAPHVELFSLIPGHHAVSPASPSVGGSLPVRAMQLCGPVVSASGYGWYVFAPLDFALRWDGDHTEWSPLADNEPTAWRSLSGGVDVPLPGGDEILAADPVRREQLAAAGRTQLAFLNADPREMSQVEFIPNIFARTSAGWSLLVRNLPNRKPITGVRLLEGIMETSWYHNLLPIVLKLTDPGRVVRIHRQMPLACIQAVPDVAYQPATMADAVVHEGLGAIPDEDFARFVAAQARRNLEANGGYRREQRADRARRRTAAAAVTVATSDASGLEAVAEEHRFVDELDIEAGTHTVTDLAGQR
jgi:hypothetical protein